ncbi:Uncharacterised protein [Salmonella enterica subsp. enterica serovar Typhimurium str. DT104]|nr:Uncharacterised protein [Salmonella enterica subsp. enterica serovar Typhimurium str. DT104]
MRVSHTFAGDFGDNVFTEIVAGSVIFIVCRQQFIQVIGVKNVNAHTGQRFAGVTRHCGGIRRFFDKINNLVAFIDRHHAERRRFFDRHRHTGHRATRALFNVIDQHTRVVLLVDMIACQDDDIFRFIATNNIQVLGHRVCRAAIPVFALHTLLGWQQIDKFVHLFAKQ